MARRVFLCGVLALSWPLLSGCDRDGVTLAFSHHLHVVENEIACSDCHGKPSNGHFSSAQHEACMSCHEDSINTKKIGEDTCGVCHKVKNMKDWKPAYAPTTNEVSGSFVHKDDMAGSCKACHGSLLDKNLRQAPKLTRGDKIRIRQQAHRSNKDCATCHVDISPDTRPSNHQGNWVRRHGVEGQQKDNVCGVCHQESSCRECHETMMPTSHNSLWRQKVHGIQATWGRERCMVCHQQDSCKDCHEQVRPQSHNAAWDQTHCLQCHFSSSGGTGCAFCHEGDLLATHPNPHAAGWRRDHCRNCHTGSPTIRQCEACHGQDLLDRHPNPHSSGWLNSHCDKCHSGAPESGQCGLCHETTSESSHSNIHPAGWRDTHCSSCHPSSSPPENNCGACHPGGDSVAIHESFWDPRHNLFGTGVDCHTCHLP